MGRAPSKHSSFASLRQKSMACESLFRLKETQMGEIAFARLELFRVRKLGRRRFMSPSRAVGSRGVGLLP